MCIDYPNGDSWLTPVSWYENRIQDIFQRSIKIVDTNRRGPEQYIQLVCWRMMIRKVKPSNIIIKLKHFVIFRCMAALNQYYEKLFVIPMKRWTMKIGVISKGYLITTCTLRSLNKLKKQKQNQQKRKKQNKNLHFFVQKNRFSRNEWNLWKISRKTF